MQPGALVSAAAIDPRQVIAQGLDAISRGDLWTAERAARAVHAIDSRHPDAWHLLALIGLARGDFASAGDACDQAIGVLPDHAPYHVTRARALLQGGRAADAERSVRHALALVPDEAATWTLLGRTLLGRTLLSGELAPHPDPGADEQPAGIEAAEDAWRKALSLDATHAEAMFCLANAALNRGALAEAIRIYGEALRRHPNDAQLKNNLGLALERSGDVQAAQARYEQALAAPDAPVEAHANLARLLQQQQDFPGAAIHYHAYVTKVDDAPADIWLALALCQHKLGALTAAEETYRNAFQRYPDDAEIKYGLCAVLVELGRSTEAIPMLDELRHRAPSGRVVHALLCARQLVCDWTDWEATLADLRARIARLDGSSADLLIPLSSLALPLTPLELLAIARRFAGTYRDAARLRPRPSPATARGSRLRIGYVSTDYRLHPIPYLMTELWERHDRNRFEVFAYSIGPPEDSPLRRRIERAFDHFIDAGTQSVEETLRRIRADRIDILIDLNGHTSGARMELFAARAAPVQMHWLGFLGTLGADWFDYIVTDRFVTPPEMQQHFTERFLYLADGYTPSDTRRAIDPEPQSREAQGLPDDGVVFCCFNNAYKILPDVFDAWMRILAAVEASVLWLSPSSEVTCAHLRHEADVRGIAPDRLIFAPRADLGVYLARLRLADLFLDTWPYNAGTTANDALYVGLPILTRAGETMASRVAASQLLTIGVPELVTFDPAEYEARAIELAVDPRRLEALREKLRVGRKESPLFDMARYVRGFEDALATAWDEHQRGSAPATS